MKIKYPHGLGRKFQKDERDKLYPAHQLLPKTSTPEVRSRFWTTGPILDQGDTSQCVAYAATQLLHSSPVINKNTTDIYTLYKDSQKLDSPPETNDDDGTTVRSMFKVLQSLGYISNYYWANTVDIIVEYLCQIGPIEFGSDWYDNMFDYNSNTGFIKIGGSIAGGHGYLLKGVNKDLVCPDKSIGAIRICNSWGTSWGYRGCAWVSIVDATKLLSDNGEAGCCTELLKK